MPHDPRDPRYNGVISSFDPDNPLEIRNIPGTDITLRVLGYIEAFDGWAKCPVIYGPDQERFTEYLEEQYDCHVCCDGHRVYLHGQERESDPKRRSAPSPCPSCVKRFSRDGYEEDIKKLIDPPAQHIFLAAARNWKRGHTPAEATLEEYRQAVRNEGDYFSFDGLGVKLVFTPFAGQKDRGRVRFVHESDAGK